MGYVGSPPTQSLLAAVLVNLHLHSEVFPKERGEAKIVISFEILDANPLTGKFLQLLEHREIFDIGE